MIPSLLLAALAGTLLGYLLGWFRGWQSRGERDAAKQNAAPKALSDDDLECLGGPLDGVRLPPAASWSCIEYPDSRGHMATTGATAFHLHGAGEVYVRGIYHRSDEGVPHLTYTPMRSAYCNSLRRSGASRRGDE